MDNYLSKTREFEFTTSDLYCNGNISPVAILARCQDIAVEHAEELKLGRNDMLNENLFWIITKYSIRILSQPRRNTKYYITTYPLKPQRAEARRDFYIKDVDGNDIIKASSYWSVLDLEKRRLRRCNILFDKYDDSVYMPDIAIEDGLQKITMLDIKCQNPLKFSVKNSDIDENNHMNNVKYANLLIDAFNYDEICNKTIAGFDINYVSELKLGDNYAVKHADFGNFSIIDAYKITETGEETSFRARVYWENNVNTIKIPGKSYKETLI